MVVGTGDRAILLEASTSPSSPCPYAWAAASMAVQFGSQVLSTAWHAPNTLIAATELGIAVLEVA